MVPFIKKNIYESAITASFIVVFVVNEGIQMSVKHSDRALVEKVC